MHGRAVQAQTCVGSSSDVPVEVEFNAVVQKLQRRLGVKEFFRVLDILITCKQIICFVAMLFASSE
jgi:hypothetical protein